MPCSRDKHQTFLCKLMHICIRMMTTGYHTSLNAYSKLITYALHKSRLKCSLHMRWYVLWSSKDTALSLSLSIAFSLLLSLYLFIELQAIFQHGAHWHRDITFYSLNCVHTHRFRSRRATSAVVWRGIQRPRRKSEFFTVFFAKKRVHVNRVKTSSVAIKVILCFHFWLLHILRPSHFMHLRCCERHLCGIFILNREVHFY